MAAAPEGVTPLFYEEEESAILAATGAAGLDLTVEESGALPRLAEVMANEGEVDVLHLSCHGTVDGGRGCCSRTTLAGARLRPSAILRRSLGLQPPEAPAVPLRLHERRSLCARGLACRGRCCGRVPGVLGWGGSVKDAEATRFAEGFYRRLRSTSRSRRQWRARGTTLLQAEPGAPT